jgi:hypothetical protein
MDLHDELARLVEMKRVAGRSQDLADIERLLGRESADGDG